MILIMILYHYEKWFCNQKKRLVFNNKFGHVLQSFSGSSTTISIQWALLFADNWRACEFCWIFNHTTYFYSLHKFFIEFRLLFAINYSPTASKQEVLWPIHLELFLSRTWFLKLKNSNDLSTISQAKSPQNVQIG